MIPRLRRYLSLHYRCKNSSRRGVKRSFAKEDNALYMFHQREFNIFQDYLSNRKSLKSFDSIVSNSLNVTTLTGST